MTVFIEPGNSSARVSNLKNPHAKRKRDESYSDQHSSIGEILLAYSIKKLLTEIIDNRSSKQPTRSNPTIPAHTSNSRSASKDTYPNARSQIIQKQNKRHKGNLSSSWLNSR